jgi:hypothetical protein
MHIWLVTQCMERAEKQKGNDLEGMRENKVYKNLEQWILANGRNIIVCNHLTYDKGMTKCHLKLCQNL